MIKGTALKGGQMGAAQEGGSAGQRTSEPGLHRLDVRV